MASTTLVSVMYHYVRPDDPAKWGGIHPLDPDEFAQQLDALASLGSIIPVSQAGASGEPVEVVLTFDDGTRDQYDYAFPELQERGLSALVSVISGPADGHVPMIHLVHVLTSKMNDADLLDGISGLVREPEIDRGKVDRFYWRESTHERRLVKYILNFALPRDEAPDVARQVYEANIGPVQELVDRWYLTPEMIREMASHGIEFAVHCHRHVPLFGPAEEYYQAEVAPCRQWLGDVLGEPPVDYIAPFGGQTASDLSLTEMRGVLEANGFRSCYTTERGINRDYSADTFFIKRLDAADLPPRQALPEELAGLA